MTEKTYNQPDWPVDLGNGFFKNPILHSAAASLSLARAGRDFYLLLLTEAGLLVLHSKDLVNWELSSKVCDLPQPAIPSASLAYRAGWFYVFFHQAGEGIYLSRTRDLAAAWSRPLQIKKTLAWTDPFAFWDDEGQAYLIHAFDPAYSDHKGLFQICRLNPDGSQLLDQGRTLFASSQISLMGPQLARYKDYYYILAAEDAKRQLVVLRSADLVGPYQMKPLLAQGNTDVNGPYRGCWLELASGQSWLLHSQNKKSSGHVIHLQPMVWQDGWPVSGRVSDGWSTGQPVPLWEKPLLHL